MAHDQKLTLGLCRVKGEGFRALGLGALGFEFKVLGLRIGLRFCTLNLEPNTPKP